MVLEEVGVFVQVDGFEREFAQALASVGVRGGVRGDAAAAEFGARAVLLRGIFVSEGTLDVEGGGEMLTW